MVPRITPLMALLLLLAALGPVTVAACTAEPVIERVEVTRVVPEQVEVTRVVRERPEQVEVTRVVRERPEQVEVTREVPVTRVVGERVEVPGPVREVVREVEVPAAVDDGEVIEAFEAVFAEFIAFLAEVPVDIEYIDEAAYDAYLQLPRELQGRVSYEIPVVDYPTEDRRIDAEYLNEVFLAALEAGVDVDHIYEIFGQVLEFPAIEVVKEVFVEVPVEVEVIREVIVEVPEEGISAESREILRLEIGKALDRLKDAEVDCTLVRSFTAQLIHGPTVLPELWDWMPICNSDGSYLRKNSP